MTSLGTWGQWNSYKTMKYENGQSCWNGPSRTATYTLKCGTYDFISNADEPSMCTYTFDFYTPVACHEEDLEKLKKEYIDLGGEL